MREPLKRALTLAALLCMSVLGVAGASAAVDRQAVGPDILFASPIASATVGGVVTVTGTATAPAGVTRVELRVDELDYQVAAGTGVWSFKLDTFAFANGPHNLKARVTDATGGQAWADLPILISNAASGAAPRVAFTSPGANGKARSLLTVSGTASSAVGLTRVDVQLELTELIGAGHGHAADVRDPELITASGASGNIMSLCELSPQATLGFSSWRVKRFSAGFRVWSAS